MQRIGRYHLLSRSNRVGDAAGKEKKKRGEEGTQPGYNPG
jgi:hypothetical protein